MKTIEKVKLLLAELEDEIPKLPNDFDQADAFDGTYKVFLTIENYEKKEVTKRSDKSMDNFSKHLLETARILSKIKGA